MIRPLPRFALALAAAVALAACKPQAPAEAPAPAAAPDPAAPAAAEPAPAPADAMPANLPFDQKGFAGTFKGTLPCADCPGIDTTLVLNADGTYRLDTVYQGKPRAFSADGTWTTEAGDRTVRLDPNSKAEQDRLFAIASNGELKALDLQGQPLPDTHPHSLMREGATTP